MVKGRGCDFSICNCIDLSAEIALCSRPIHRLFRARIVRCALFGINSTNYDRVVIFAGGMPIKKDGTVIGAVGASGGTVDQDEKVAEAAVTALAKS
ncbi:MAG TPA: heme-binding protein [Steroidobacteraceae bacterium]